MKKATGAISFFGAIVSLIFLIYIFFDEELYDDNDKGLLLWIALFILSLCVIYFCFASKFWTSKISVIESLDRENEIIKKQIEKRELLAKLENLEKK